MPQTSVMSLMWCFEIVGAFQCIAAPSMMDYKEVHIFGILLVSSSVKTNDIHWHNGSSVSM
jgi:hypothetical protein